MTTWEESKVDWEKVFSGPPRPFTEKEEYAAEEWRL